MSTTMDNSSDDDDISTIANLNNEFFYTHFFKDWPDSEFDDDADLMVAVASILHEENETYMPQWRGSMLGRAANLHRNWEAGHVQLYADYFYSESRCTETIFNIVFGCQGSCLDELLKVFASMTHISNASRMPHVNLASLPIKMLGGYMNACLWSLRMAMPHQ
jgi:hypothetical protein